MGIDNREESGKRQTVSDMAAVLGAFMNKRSYASKGALWFYIGKRMPYSEFKSILKRLERNGIVRISKGRVSICESELARVKMGQQSEILDDPAKILGPLLVYYKRNGKHHIASSTVNLKYMEAMRALFKQNKIASPKSFKDGN